MTYEMLIWYLKEIAKTISQSGNLRHQEAIDFAVEWFEANQDDVREFLGELD